MRDGLRARGLQSMKADYSTEDGMAGLSAVKFRTGVMSDITGADFAYGPTPAQVTLGRDKEGAEIMRVHGWGDDEDSLQAAGEQIFENVVEFIYATQGDEVVIDGFDLAFNVSGGLHVEIQGPEPRIWEGPDHVETGDQLLDWVDREVEKLHEGMSARFEKYAQAWINKIARDYPDLNPDVVVGNGDMFIHGDHPDHGRWLLNHLRDAEVDEIWPGLASEIEKMNDLLSKLDALFAMPSTEVLTLQDEGAAPSEEDSPEP